MLNTFRNSRLYKILSIIFFSSGVSFREDSIKNVLIDKCRKLNSYIREKKWNSQELWQYRSQDAIKRPFIVCNVISKLLCVKILRFDNLAFKFITLARFIERFSLMNIMWAHESVKSRNAGCGETNKCERGAHIVKVIFVPSFPADYASL